MLAVGQITVVALVGGRGAHKGEETLILIQTDTENGASGLKTVLECFIQNKRCLDLHECSKLRLVVLDEHAVGARLFLDKGVSARDRDILDTHISIVAASQLDLVKVVEVDDMDLLLLFIFLLWIGLVLTRVELEGLQDEEIAIRPVDLVKPVLVALALVHVRVTELAELTMEGLPCVSGDVGCNFSVFTPAQPLPEAIQMNHAHRSGAFARTDERIRLGVRLLREADTAHSLADVALTRFICIRVSDYSCGRLFNQGLIHRLLVLGFFGDAIDLNLAKTHFGLVVGDVINFALSVDLDDLDDDAANLESLTAAEVERVAPHLRILVFARLLGTLQLLVLIALHFTNDHPKFVHFAL